MPANFPTADQNRHYARFADSPDLDQLGRYFHLAEADRRLVYERRRDHTRLGLAIQVGIVRFLGTFLMEAQWNTVPTEVIRYVAAQLDLQPGLWSEYLRHRQTVFDHQAFIRQHYGYREFNHQAERFVTLRWLYTRVWLHAESPSQLFDLLVMHLRERQVLLPGISTLERCVNRVRDRVARRIWARLDRQLTEAQRTKLQGLVASKYREQTLLDQLRHGPVAISPTTLKEALLRVNELRKTGVGALNVNWVSPDRLKKLARHTGMSKAYTIDRLSEPRKWATLAAFAYVYESRAIDDALDLFDGLVQTRLTRIGQQGEKKRIRTLRDLDGAARELRDAGALLMTFDPDEPIVLNDVFFNVIPRGKLEGVITQIDELTRPPDDQYLENLLNHYSQFRRFLPVFWATLQFGGLESEVDLLEAVDFLKGLENQNLPTLPRRASQRIVDAAPQSVITNVWKPLVFEEDGHIHLPSYTFCVLLQLRDALRRRAIFVAGSERWGDIRDKLLPEAAWKTVKTKICRTLGQPAKSLAALSALEMQLDAAYRQVGENLPENTRSRLERVADKTRFVLEPLEAQDEPGTLISLRQTVYDLLPRVDMPDIIQEVAAWTGCLSDFTHLSEGQKRAKDLPLSLCAALLAEAMNLGLSPFSKPEVAALSRGRLTWVRHNYIRTETIVKANARLVAMQDTLPLAHAWGGGEVAVADGLRFVVPVRTAHAGASRRYFGARRGVTWYHWMVDQYMDIHGTVVAGSLRDAPYVLDGLLEQETHHRPREVITDTGGYSDIVFGFFWLLGYQFSPRLADLGDARFWRIDRKTDYGVLNDLARHKVNINLVAEQWDDMIRAAGSLHMGTVKASELIKSLHRAGRTSTLGRAVGEIGRLAKTIFLLSYVDDSIYRRRVLTQLNRIEHRHRLAGAIYFGRKGKLYQHYRQGQEDQLNALGLVLNMVVLWTTRYMDAVLDHLHSSGYDVRQEDVERLSPLVSHHINFVGKYHFSLPEEVLRGELRPFHDPRDPAHLI